MLRIFPWVFFVNVYVFFGEMSIRSSTHFLIGLFYFILSCLCCLYILEINPLLVALFANIFSHSEGCLEWIKKMWYIYTMEYYSTIKRNEIMPLANQPRDLYTARSKSESERQILCNIAYMWNLEK